MDGKAQEIIRGTVLAVLFQNQENGYTVIRFTTEQQNTITVVGTIPLCTPGEQLAVTGHWEEHQTHGLQFHAEFLERVMPAGAQAPLASAFRRNLACESCWNFCSAAAYRVSLLCRFTRHMGILLWTR